MSAPMSIHCVEYAFTVIYFLLEICKSFNLIFLGGFETYRLSGRQKLVASFSLVKYGTVKHFIP